MQVQALVEAHAKDVQQIEMMDDQLGDEQVATPSFSLSSYL